MPVTRHMTQQSESEDPGSAKIVFISTEDTPALEAKTSQPETGTAHRTWTKKLKLPDPSKFYVGSTGPIFLSRKIAIHKKLTVNKSLFPDEEVCMANVFDRTEKDAQMHLQPRARSASPDPWVSADDMIAHLASIYRDRYQTQNSRANHRSLNMNANQTFAEFYTRFLHLAGEGQIPINDWLPGPLPQAHDQAPETATAKTSSNEAFSFAGSKLHLRYATTANGNVDSMPLISRTITRRRR
ncbi:hypothetical protein V1515DRAFT_582232 [Lipomyces mesembrius]